MKNTKIYLAVAALAAMGLVSCSSSSSSSSSVAAPAAPTLVYDSVAYGKVGSSGGVIGSPSYKFTWAAVEGATVYTFYLHTPAAGEVKESYTSIIETPALEYTLTYETAIAKTIAFPLSYDTDPGDYGFKFALTAGTYVSGQGKVESGYSADVGVTYTVTDQADSTAYAETTAFPVEAIDKEFAPCAAWGVDDVVGYAPAAYEAWSYKDDDGNTVNMPAWAGLTATAFKEAHFAYSYTPAEGSEEASESNARVDVYLPTEAATTTIMNLHYAFTGVGYTNIGANKSRSLIAESIALDQAGVSLEVYIYDCAAYTAAGGALAFNTGFCLRYLLVATA